MAKNAICIRPKAANRYNASRPCHFIIADGTQAGITAPKMANGGSTLMGLVAPDGSSDVAAWKTLPVTGGARSTTYSCANLAPLIASITGWYVIETPMMIVVGLETGGVTPIAHGNTFWAGEALIALDTSMGEAAGVGNADGLTMYGILGGVPNKLSAAGNLGISGGSNSQSRVFIGADTTARPLMTTNAEASNFATAQMNPVTFGTGKFLMREFQMKTFGAFRMGDPPWLAACTEGAHWSIATVSGQTTRVLGSSSIVSYAMVTPYRKNGASADTIYHRRTAFVYATWPDLIQAIWDDIGLNGVYWQQDSSA